MPINSIADATAAINSGVSSSIQMTVDGRRHLQNILQIGAMNLLAEPTLESQARMNMEVFGSKLLEESASQALSQDDIQRIFEGLCPLFPICK